MELKYPDEKTQKKMDARKQAEETAAVQRMSDRALATACAAIEMNSAKYPEWYLNTVKEESARRAPALETPAIPPVPPVPETPIAPPA